MVVPEEQPTRPAALPAVLFADGDEAMRGVVHDVLESDGFRVILAADGLEALDLLVTAAPAIVVADLRMAAGGVDLVARLRRAAPATPIILIGDFGESAELARSRMPAVDAYFSKPVRMAELKAAIRRLLAAS